MYLFCVLIMDNLRLCNIMLDDDVGNVMKVEFVSIVPLMQYLSWFDVYNVFG